MKRVLIFSLLLGGIVYQNALAQHLEYIGEYGPFEDATSLCIAESYAYIADCDGNSLEIINISDPSSPEFVGNCDTANPVWDVSVKDGYAYMATTPNHIAVIDVSDPTNPFLVATRSATEQAVNLFISGNYLYATEFFGFEIFDMNDPEYPVSIYFDVIGESWDVYVSGNYAYVTNIDDPAFNMCPIYPEICGLKIMDVTEPAEAFIIGSVDGISVYPVFVSGNYAYVARLGYGENLLFIIDVTDRSQPFIAGDYLLAGQPMHISVSGPYLFAPYRVDQTGNLEVINIADPANPQLVTEHDTYGRPWDISVRGEYAYVLNNTSLVILKFVNAACEGSYIAGDCNHNGVPLQLADVTAMIGMYRGTSLPCYVCDCQPHGFAFAATADPNGNCVAFELGDVVTEIGAYRGLSTVSSCEDCPGSGR